MSELDTISDFTDYLDKRSIFLRSGRLAAAHGEEDLLAYYATNINESGDHDFVPPDGKSWEEVEAIALGPRYGSFVRNPRYIAKKRADEVSYAWDRLIETFTQHMLSGTSIVVPGQVYSLTNSEMAVRYMALESRFKRRSHSEAILGALKRGETEQVFFRAMIAPAEARYCETGFFFMTLKFMTWMEADGGYEKYRIFRTFYLKTYAQALLVKFPYLKRVVGIAMEPPNQGRGASEDCIYAAQAEWTDAELAEIKDDCEGLGIMKSLVPREYGGEEFPQVERERLSRPLNGLEGNRKERRARAAAARALRKRPLQRNVR
ncbi:hypothetical protein [Mesorhizobium sp. M0296]|uniref:hypothetical protein n=1 Tax=Mesorhizobium sp. M0296 TaxID=2956931 RepID=UPI003338176A